MTCAISSDAERRLALLRIAAGRKVATRAISSDAERRLAQYFRNQSFTA